MTRPALDLQIDAGDAVGATRWQQLVQALFGAVDLRVGDQRAFSARLRHVALDDVELADVSTAYEDVDRRPRHVAADERRSHVLVAPLEGVLHLEQGPRECSVGPGQYALFDLNRPHRYRHAGRLRALSMKAPSELLQARMGPLDPLLATPFPAHQGVARVTLDFIASLLREHPHLPGSTAAAYAARSADLAALMLNCAHDDHLPEAVTSLREALHARCLRIVESRLADPDLGPATVAAACGISTRYLHKVFKEAGHTLGDHIRQRRLEVCRDRLLAQGGRTTVKAVALSTGFRSLSHFCNAFKARYGVSPRELQAPTH